VLSTVVIDNVPLEGRDVYALLLLLPGVTSDLATARGLGFFSGWPAAVLVQLSSGWHREQQPSGHRSAECGHARIHFRSTVFPPANYSAEYGRTFRLYSQRYHPQLGNQPMRTRTRVLLLPERSSERERFSRECPGYLPAASSPTQRVEVMVWFRGPPCIPNPLLSIRVRPPRDSPSKGCVVSGRNSIYLAILRSHLYSSIRDRNHTHLAQQF